jgi:hypothetical protein
MAAKNQGNGGEMQYGDDDASRKRLRKENGVSSFSFYFLLSLNMIELIQICLES